MMDPQRQFSLPVTAIISVVVAFTIAVLSQMFVFSTYHVPSASMAPTMTPGDAVIVSGPLWDALDPGPIIERGDMIVFSDELGWLTGSPSSDSYLTKRVIGLPGDTISQTEDGTLLINDQPYREPYAVNPGPQTPYSVTIPEGKLWVMGDNRQNSADSRYHYGDNRNGFVDISSVEGTVRTILPLHRLSFQKAG